MTEFVRKVVGGIILVLILNGYITTPEQLKGEVDATELRYMSGASEIENGNET